MPFYRYESFTKQGTRKTGMLDATSLQMAKELLRGQGLMPTSITEVLQGAQAGFSLTRLFEKKIDTKTVIVFTKQFSVLLRSSIPLLQTLELLIEQFEGRFQRALITIKDDIKSGMPLAKALAKYPYIFSSIYVQLVRAGEASGKLDQILERLTQYLERTEETRQKIKKATSYPIMMLSFAGLVVLGLLTLLVPRLTGLFTQMGKELPGPTQLLVTLSDMLTANFMIIGIIVFISAISFKYWKSTPRGKLYFDQLLLRFRPTAYFARTKAVVQFCKTLGMLIESGVNMSEALDIVCNIVDNKVLVKKLQEARDKIIKEGKITRYLKQTGIFPNVALYMISTGEESGKLGQMLLSVGNDYEVELQEQTDKLTAKVGPVMTLVLGLVVGFILLSVFLPIMEMGDLAGM